MKKLKFIIAIPTFNRLLKLKETVNSILRQKFDNLELKIVISNSFSNDGTYQYLETLRKDSRFIISNKEETCPKHYLSQFINFRNLAKLLPNDADWVWWLGDDDKMVSKSSLSLVAKKIKEFDCNDLHFVHACHPDRASKNCKVFKDNILNLCDTFGYHELLGWMSSIILKKSALKKILIDSTQNLYFIDTKDQSASSCFAHSASILKHYHAKKGLFLDYPLVTNQDEKQTIDTKKRWEKENVGNRYFKIIDDIFDLKDKLPKKSFSRNFFRYQTYHLWDHLGEYLIRKAIVIGKKCIEEGRHVKDSEFVYIREKWLKIVKIAELLEDLESQKILGFTFQSGLNYSNLYLSTLSEEIKNDYLLKLRQIICITNYQKSIAKG